MTGGDGPMPFITFENNTVSLFFPVIVIRNSEKYVGSEYIQKAKYSFSIVNGIYHIKIQSDQKIELYLLFDNEFGYFSIVSPDKYKDDSGILLRVTEEIIPKLPKGGGEDWLYEDTGNALLIKTSSSLKENGKEYSGNNLKYLFKTSPWVEGKEDAGIGEYIEFDFSNTFMKKTDTIVMSNGFFSHNNPSLYNRNNRVKRIRIEDINGNYKQEFEVLDTANLQTFKLKDFYSKIRITILDIYPGTEYNDTCINYLNGIDLCYKKW
jgi:hypothetical protein